MLKKLRCLALCFLLGFCAVAKAEEQRLQPAKIEYSSKQIEGAKKIKHVIVIFQENWSFDSLYGQFPNANGIAKAKSATTQQIDKMQTASPSLPPCIDTRTHQKYPTIPLNLPNGPFDLAPYIPLTQNTGDLTHRFYQEIAQINGGKMDAFARESDAGGFVMSYYDITSTRLGKISQQYTLCDNFFHSFYGGSLLNVLALFSAQMPTWENAPAHLVAKLSPDGTLLKDGKVSPDGYLINDAEPYYIPHKANVSDADRVPPLTTKTIGDLLSEKNISWGWYAEGWADAIQGKASPAFTFHYQAPTYFKQFSPGTKERIDHLFDLSQFYKQLDEGTLPAVCFIRPFHTNSQHPGDGALLTGLNWSADLIERIQKSSLWKDCAIIATYDENGGRWDHVPPPNIDRFGPGTRIPAVIISPFAKKSFVDHTIYETVSILKFIEERWELQPLSTRDKEANNLLNAFEF